MDSLGLWKASSEEKESGDIPRKLDEVEYSKPKKNYEKLGSAGIKGSLYQIDLLTLVLLNGMHKVKNWRLSTEDKEAAQLDDLIFEHLLPSESTILLQAKHKEDEKKEVTYKDLMSVGKNPEFSLPKYFFSYQEVKSKFKVRNVVICTNLKLDKKTKSILKEETVDPDSVLHFEGAENICYGFSGCALPELEQNIKKYHAKYITNKEVPISDEDINDFLKHLKFFSNCLGEKNIDNIMQQTIARMKISENLNSKMIQTYIQRKMMDWFKEKKGRYLTEVEAKAFFCDMRSNAFCQDLKLYDTSFKNNNLPRFLQTQQRNEKKGGKSVQQIDSDVEPKRISHIIPDKEYILNVAKIYQALPHHHKDKALFVNPDDSIEVQKEIIDAFKVQHYTILVMACPNMMEATVARYICDILMQILDTYKYKHVILIAEERNCLATQLKDANIDNYEAIADNVTFADLEETTRGEFKRKKLINFQGSTMSLEELFSTEAEDNLNQIVNSELVIHLARGDKFEVGRELQHPDNYYISRSFNRNGRNISEDDLWRSTEVSEEKIILISGSAGMGKSSVLTSLAVSIKRDNPHLWVVRIDLNNYTNVMEATLEGGRKSVSIVEILNSQENSKLKSEFDIKLFNTPKRVVLMLDGVDEVSPTYTEWVINLIRGSLGQVNVAKIFVTTRPHMSKDFAEISELQSFKFEPLPKNQQQEIPDVKSFTLEPFSKVNQTVFLIKYWSETLELQDDVRKSKCNTYAEALIENISVWINEKERENFAGIPLQTRMLAEIFQEKHQIADEDDNWEGCKEFLSSSNKEPKFPTRFDVIELYKLFIDKKYEIFIKKSNPSRSIVADEALKRQLEKCQEFHRALAFRVIFNSDNELQFFTNYTNLEWPIPSAFANDYLLKVGIVQMQGGNIEFLHRTIAEYFVAEWLLIELDCKPVNEIFQRFLMRSIMMDKEFYVIRAFFDSRMRNVMRPMENNFLSYFRRNRISQWSLSRYLKVFAEGGCTRILEAFVKCIYKEQLEILSETVNNVYLMDDALHFAIRYGHLNILSLLLELNQTLNIGKDTYKEYIKCAVMHAVDHNLETFKFLLGQIDRDGNGRTALHKAAFMGQLKEVEFLVKYSGADINIKDNILGWTALHEAVLTGQLEIVKFLVEEAGADINIKDDIFGRTVFHEAVYWGRLEIVKFLVEKAGADIYITDNGGKTALHRAAYGGKLEIVRFLVKEGGADINVKDNNGETALHGAVYRGQLKVVKFLVEEARADIYIKDDIFGRTVLHEAVYRGRLEIVKFLVEKAGANIYVKDSGGKTALHRAAYGGKLEIVKFLVQEAGADTNVQDSDGETVLHGAVYRCQLKVVKFLVEEAGVDINTNDNIFSRTALHTATLMGRIEVVKFLVEKAGADVNIKNDCGETVLHLAAYGDNLEIVKFLVDETGVDINAGDNIFGRTALHIATLTGHFEVVKFLTKEARTDINTKDKNGWTALHIAAHKGELETVKFLVGEAQADVNIESNHGRTALRVAADQGHWMVVKFLSNSNRWVMLKMKAIQFCRGKFP